MSAMKSIDEATDNDEEVHIVKVPKVMFDDDGRGIRINRRHGSIENSFKKGRHKMMVQVREVWSKETLLFGLNTSVGLFLELSAFSAEIAIISFYIEISPGSIVERLIFFASDNPCRSVRGQISCNFCIGIHYNTTWYAMGCRIESIRLGHARQLVDRGVGGVGW